NSAKSIFRHSAASRLSSPRVIHFRNFSAAQYKITPTLRNSSRSMWGTTRITAYSNKCESCIDGFFNKLFRVRNALFEETHVRLAMRPNRRKGGFIRQPLLWNQADDFPNKRRRQRSLAVVVDLLQFTRP